MMFKGAIHKYTVYMTVTCS